MKGSPEDSGEGLSTGGAKKCGVRSDGDRKFYGLWSGWQIECKNGAAAERALDRDAAVMRFHDRRD